MERKKSAYLKRESIGWFGFELVVKWIARDTWGNWVTSGKTRKECEANCRMHGYVPRR